MEKDEYKAAIKALLIMMLFLVMSVVYIAHQHRTIDRQKKTIDSLYFANQCMDSFIHPELHND